MENRTKRSEKGFTLIELLVVIAIISLLVSILLPSLKKAKDLARTAVCLNNQRSILTGMNVYQAEHDGLFPQNAVYGWEYLICSPTKGEDDEKGLFPTYVESSDVFYCPAMTSQDIVEGSDAGWNYNPPSNLPHVVHVTHYWMYFATGRYVHDYSCEPRVKNLGMFTPIPGETLDYSSKASEVVAMTCWPEAQGCMGEGTWMSNGHSRDYLPAGFLDGHAEAIERDELIYDSTNFLVPYARAVRRPFIGQSEFPKGDPFGEGIPLPE